jgi:hypothetical protein
MLKHAAWAAACAAAWTVAANGQLRGGWMLEVEYMPGSGGVVSPAFPEATVTLLAWFENAYAFAGGDGDIVADDGTWKNIHYLEVQDPPQPPPPGTPPYVNGSRLELFIVGQIMYLPVIYPSTANPIPLMEATWYTGDFTPRLVGLVTENTARFSVYDQTGRSWPIDPATLGHGSAPIKVVPTPPAAAGLAAALVLVLSRRRGVIT